MPSSAASWIVSAFLAIEGLATCPLPCYVGALQAETKKSLRVGCHLVRYRDNAEHCPWKMTDVVRVHYILPDRDDFPRCWPLLREAFGGATPAATMIVAGLSDTRIKIEIEVTAHRPGP